MWLPVLTASELGRVMGATAVAGVFASADLLDAIILPHFTRREAAQVCSVVIRCVSRTLLDCFVQVFVPERYHNRKVARVSRGFNAAVQRCVDQLRPRLIVACSGSSKLVEIDPWTGASCRPCRCCR